MRFESLLWMALMLFIVGAAGGGDKIVGAAAGSGEFQAADGGTDIPPPRR